MRRVVVESPFRGNRELHVSYAKEALLDSLRRGEAPLASHLLYPQVLDDDVADERRQGIAGGHAWIPHADALAVYHDHGVSNGMQRGISVARLHGIPIEMRRLTEEHAA